MNIKYNDNQFIIHKKQIEYKKSVSDFTTEAFEKYNFYQEAFLKYFNDQIEAIDKDIKIKLI